MSQQPNAAFSFDALEARRLLTSTTGYLPDYHYSGTINNLDWSALTTINYFSVKPNGTTGAMPGTGSEPAVSTSGYSLSQLSDVVTKAHAKGVKVNIVLGGAGTDETLTTLIDHPDRLPAFAASVQEFADKYGVDGVDLDWELYTPTQTELNGYADLIHTLRTNTTGLDLSAAVYPEGVEVSGLSYSLQQLTPGAIADLDQVNVMDYDLDYANNAPVQRSENDMANWAYYTANSSQPKTKLSMGLPFYGKAGTSWSNSSDLSYADIVSGYKSAHGGQTPPADSDPDTDSAVVNGKTWYYNGPSTIQAKAAWAKANGYGGVMVWDLGHDIYTNGKPDATLSLTAAIQRGLGNTTPTQPTTVGTIAGKVQNASGTGFGGVTVYVDADNDAVFDTGELSTTTDQNGNYSIGNVPAGSDRIVRQVPRGDLTQVKPTNNYGIHVAVTAGQTKSGQNFTDALKQAAAVGTVIGNVSNSAGGMNGVTIYFDADNDGVFDSTELHTTTGTDGNFTLANVPSGDRTIRQVVPTGYYQGAPSAGSGLIAHVITGKTTSSLNFSDVLVRQAATATINGTVFNDKNGNGVQNTGETGLSGWKVFIDSDNDGVFDTGELSVNTTSSGTFSFTGLQSGTYKVRVVKPSGYVQTIPTQNYGRQVTLATGATASGVLFGARLA